MLRALPLRRQLFVAITLLLVPILVAAVWSGYTTLREREQDLGRQAQLVATATVAYVEGDLAQLDRLGRGLARDPALARFDASASRQLLTNIALTRPTLLDLQFWDGDGTLITRARISGVVDAPPAPATDAGRIVTPMQTLADGTHYIAVGYPVTPNDGARRGRLWLLVNLEPTQRAFEALPLPAGSVVTITDASHIVLVRSLDPAAHVGRPLHADGSFDENADLSDHLGSDGVRRVYARRDIPTGPWVLSVGIPRRLALINASAVWTRSLAILGFGLVGWLVVAVAMSRRLSTSVQHLDDAAQRIAAGDFRPIDEREMPSRELKDLQDAFALMLTRFNETRGELDRHLAEERRIREELQSLQRQVIRQERLAAVGQLVSGVAHEINNPLQSILGFAELLQMQGDVPESVKSDLRLIQKEGARACGIIRNLAMFARQQTGEAAPVRLSDIVTAVVELRQRQLQAENIDLAVEDLATQPVMAVSAELQQVALNFLVNAEQAIVTSGRLPGRIVIRTYDREEMVGFEVEDTGPGVLPENEPKLFQPFFTTKPVGTGTGLGLSVSYGIIDSMGGRIGHRRAAAGGAVFYFELQADARQ
ncbi:MAG: ATP-binding protein [Vicinamibacterales bacterium]